MRRPVLRLPAAIPAVVTGRNGRENSGAHNEDRRIAQGSHEETQAHIRLAREAKSMDKAGSVALPDSGGHVGKSPGGLIRFPQSSQAAQ
jgi:hypothetical protein